MKITKRIVKRQLTEEEFLLQKSDKYYDDFRQIGKQNNFLNIFGGSPRTFAERVLETRWTNEMAEKYITDNNIEHLREDLRNKYFRETDEKLALITVAANMQNLFFTAYKGLQRRIRANRDFAKKNGYVRTVFGATRKLIEQLLRGDYDNKVNSGHMRNLDNIAANTDIQGFEAGVIHPAMVKLDKWFVENNMKSIGWNCVHDSHDLYVHKSEIKEVAEMIEKIFTEDIPELKGLPLTIDFAVSDLSKGQIYKDGGGLHTVL